MMKRPATVTRFMSGLKVGGPLGAWELGREKREASYDDDANGI